MAQLRILITLVAGILIGVVGMYLAFVPRTTNLSTSSIALTEKTIYLDQYNNIEVTTYFDEATQKGAEKVYLLQSNSSKKLIYTRELPTGSGIQLPIQVSVNEGKTYFLIGHGWRDYAIVDKDGGTITESIVQANFKKGHLLYYFENPADPSQLWFNVFDIFGKQIGSIAVNPQNGQVTKQSFAE